MKKIGWAYLLCAVLCMILFLLTYTAPFFDGYIAILTSSFLVSIYISIISFLGKKKESKGQQKIDFLAGVLFDVFLILCLSYVIFMR